MTRLTIFYILNWLGLTIYIVNTSLYLSHGEMGVFQIIMAVNTPLFLIITIKAFTKGISKLFKSDEHEFRYLASSLLVFTYIFTGIDAKVLAIYRDHFNIKLFGILFETGVMQDLGVRSSDLFSLGIQIFGICIWVWISLFVSNWVFENKRNKGSELTSKNIQIAFKILIYLSMVEKLLFSYFHYTDRERINGYWASIPSYTVLKMSKVWNPFIHTSPDSEREAAKITWNFENDFLLAQSQFKRNISNMTAEKTNVNIVFLVFESLRSDVKIPEIMPNLSRLSREWISSDRHFSNSNCTGNGTFGILTGMTPFYWYPSYKAEYQPTALTILDHLGYNIDVYTTTKLGYSDMNKHIFTDAVDNVYEFTGYGGGLGHPMVKRSDLYKWDEMMVDKFLTNFKSREPSTPSMSYLWFYSTHYNYYFPESFGKFKPYIDRHYQIYEPELQKESHLVFNRYKNSAFYADHLIGKITDAIKESGQSENTIIVILGDHGEEFNEFGRFAHSYSLKNVQSSTPFVMHLPGILQSNYKVTSHADIMPSIMDFMGVSIPNNQLFSGKSLLQYNEDLDFAIVQECEIKNRPKKFLIADSDWKLEFTLSKGKIEAGNLETILDKPISSIEGVDYTQITKELLKKAKKNLGHFSNSH